MNGVKLQSIQEAFVRESFVCSNDMYKNFQANAIFIEKSSVRKGVF